MSIVLGLGFGDEGKGLTTSYLCNEWSKPLVVRFNGGHQAGHTVYYNDLKHVFSNFGSGTLQGVKTYWSEFCTIHPTGFMNEYRVLKGMNILQPSITASSKCPITTPYEVKLNQFIEEQYRNGSVGVGFGATIARQEAHHSITLLDTQYPKIFEAKLKLLKTHYIGIEVSDEEMGMYLNDVYEMRKLVELDLQNDYLKKNKDKQFVFEGAQGILLDQNHGFFPNVTRSNTTSKNALTLTNKSAEDFWYVTRCYQTRHGAGFMTNEVDNLYLQNAENETNIYNPWQGKLRVGELDPTLLNYALDCDSLYRQGGELNLVITCIDQMPDFDIDKLLDELDYGFDNFYISKGPNLADIEQY